VTQGVKDVSPAISAFRSTVSYTDWLQKELEDGEAATVLENRQLTYRGIFEQQQAGAWTGSFGFSGSFRRYKSLGEESLAPHTSQQSIAGFVLEEVQLSDRAKAQLGGRVDYIRYRPDSGVTRGFTGLSGGAGIHVGLWSNGVAVANFTSSYRAPALEELYNNGPHHGNLAFEIGNDQLRRERSHGIDLSLRHQDTRVRGEFNVFYYDIRDFVYLDPTGEEREELNVYNYSQAGARFAGTEACHRPPLQKEARSCEFLCKASGGTQGRSAPCNSRRFCL
jgi:iron complex outermembrane receptor protein